MWGGTAISCPRNKRVLKLGEKEIVLNPNFRMFMQTKLSNPHYPPEIQAECTIINFTVTEAGLEDQLLFLVVRLERPDLAKRNLVMSFSGQVWFATGTLTCITQKSARSSTTIAVKNRIHFFPQGCWWWFTKLVAHRCPHQIFRCAHPKPRTPPHPHPPHRHSPTHHELAAPSVCENNTMTRQSKRGCC